MSENNRRNLVPRRLDFWLIVLVVAMAAYAVGSRWPMTPQPPAWQRSEIPIQAYATDNNPNLVIATGQVADDVEGVFFLDTLSGDLQCAVYSPTAGAFNSLFTRNVLADLQLEATKQPAYLMVTGQINSFRRAARDIGNCIVYVAEANTGRFAAYSVPWKENVRHAPQRAELVLLGVDSVRTAAVRQ